MNVTLIEKRLLWDLLFLDISSFMQLLHGFGSTVTNDGEDRQI